VRRLLILGCVVALVLAASAYAAFFSQTTTPSNSFTANSSFCVSPGQQTATADADAWVKEDAASTNNGTTSPLDVKGASPKRRRSYIHFTLPTTPHNCDVTAATLRLNLITGGGLQTDVLRAAGTWVETTISWGGGSGTVAQPGWTGTAATLTPAAGNNDWNVLSIVQALYSGTNTGFVVADHGDVTSGTGTANDTYASREAASNKPTLLVTFG
jgi:hypothetical protein